LTEKPASVRTIRDTVPLHVDYAIDHALAGRTVVPATTSLATPIAKNGRRVLAALPWALLAASVARRRLCAVA
jgi:hypothetical protein